MGKQISDEARALSNAYKGNEMAYLSFWAPNINCWRDPRWGRGYETPGEDPYLVSEYGIKFVTGMQDNSKYLKTVPQAKHYAAYDLDHWTHVDPQADRHKFNAIVTKQEMAAYFNKPFERAVKEADLRGVMCSYNEINGIPACCNQYLLNDLLRDKWNFQGHVVSDCGAINDIWGNHFYVDNMFEAASIAIKNGDDLNCGSAYKNNLAIALEQKLVKESDIDVALTHLFKQRIALGEYDDWSKQEYRKIPISVVNSKEHQDLSLLLALESLVLLKNEKNVLPLDRSKYKNIAVIGPNANATGNMQGPGYNGPAPYLISPLMGLSKYVETHYSVGCDIDSKKKDHFEEAKKMASQSDATVLVMGLDSTIEREGHGDRYEITWPGVQQELIKEVTAVSKGPVILCMVKAGQIDISWSKENVNAIVDAGYPSQSGGDAIAKVLYGDYNPSGLLTYTVYPAKYVNEVKFTDMNLRKSEDNPGRTYWFYEGKTIYPFGYGLSYTSFSFEFTSNETIVFDKSNVTKKAFQIKVTNEGGRVGDVVVLAFITSLDNPDFPKKALFDFQRVNELKPTEKRNIEMQIGEKALEYTNKDGDPVILGGNYLIKIGYNDVVTKKVSVE